MSRDPDQSTNAFVAEQQSAHALSSAILLFQPLIDVGSLDAGEISRLWQSLPSAARPQSAAEVTSLLIDKGRLTPFQAEEALGGRAQNLFIHEYFVLDRIGAGGMGQVFKARHRRMERIVALKQIGANFTKNEAALKRFQREVKAAAKLSHPNIVTAHDAGEVQGMHFLILEYVDGIDLGRLVKQNGPLSVEQAVDCTLQAAKGLAYAHDKGVVHRDVKPANLLLDREGIIKVLDLGLAHLDDADDGLTGTEQVMGTADYMSPEQSLDSKHVDGRADVYSLGCTLWYLLTGARVYDGDSPVQRIMRHRDAPIPSLRERCPSVPPELEALFRQMLEKQPADRPASMAEVVASLMAIRSLLAGATAQNLPAAGGQLGDSLRSLNPPAVAGPTTAISDAFEATDQHQDRRKTSTMSFSAGSKLVASNERGWWCRNRVTVLSAAAAFAFLFAGIVVYIKSKPGNVPKGGPGTMKDTNHADKQGPREAAWNPGPEKDVLPGIAFRPAKLNGVGRWNVETTTPRSPTDSVSLSPDGKLLALGGRATRIISVDTGELNQMRSDGWVFWNRDGSRILNRGFDNALRVSDPMSGKQTAAIDVGTIPFRGFSWSRDGRWLAWGCSWGTKQSDEIGLPIRLADGKPSPKIENREIVRAVVFCPNADRLATAGSARAIRIWDADFKLFREIPNQISAINFLSWQPEGKWVAAGYEDGHLRVWNVDNGNKLADVAVAHSFINGIAVSPDGGWLAVASQDGWLRFVSVADWDEKPECSLYFKEDLPQDVIWFPDNSGVVLRTERNVLRASILGKRSVHELAKTGPLLRPGRTPLAVASDGTRFASVESDGVHVRRTADSALLAFIPNQSAAIFQASWNRDGTQLATTGTEAEAIQIWNVPSGRKIGKRSFSEPISARSVDWSPDGHWIAAAGLYGKRIVCRVWSAEKEDGGRELFAGIQGADLFALAWSPDSKLLALSAGGRIHVAEADNWSEVWTSDPIESLNELAWSPDSRQLLAKTSYQADVGFQVFGLKDGKPLHDVPERLHWQAAWNSGQDRLAIAEKLDARIRILNAADFSLVRDINSRTEWLAWLPNQPRLLGGDDGDSTTVLWNTNDGQPVWTSVLLPNNKVAVFNCAGQLLPSSTPGAEDQLVYMIQRADGTLEYLSFAEFSRRFPDAKLSSMAIPAAGVARVLAEKQGAR